MCYSVQLKDRIFVKGMCKNIVKNKSKNLSSKYTQKLLDLANQSTTGALKTAQKKVIKKNPAEQTGEFNGNKIANRIMEISKNSQQNNSETVSNDHDREVPKERYVSPKERQIIINNLRLI